jgi:putative protease
VKNVTAAYRKRLDEIFERREEYVRASSGHSHVSFTPQLNKSFSRGFTNYFLDGRNADIYSFDTPKSLGEEMGRMKEARGNYIVVAGLKAFNNGDGVCYLDEQGRLKGFRINRVENNKIFPQEMPRIAPRTLLYRNFDQEFEKTLSKPTADRKLNVDVELAENNFGLTLSMRDEDGVHVSITHECTLEDARTPQENNIRTQLGKLGNTPFEAVRTDVNLSGNRFIPSSLLADMRRRAVDKLLEARRTTYKREIAVWRQTSHRYTADTLTYLGNVMNSEAERFYAGHGVKSIAPAFEKEPVADATLMFCKHCLRYSMGWCVKRGQQKSPYHEPYYLVSSDGKRYHLSFDCKNCQMLVNAES